jgi:hypothetical protein
MQRAMNISPTMQELYDVEQGGLSSAAIGLGSLG